MIQSKTSLNWENVISYWKAYKLSNELKQYISLHADELSKENIEVVPDNFMQEFILTNVETTIKERLLPVLRMKNFDIVLSSIDEPTLRIMIDCQYFAFTVDTYSGIDSVSSDMSLMFILKNQDAYMRLHENIPMTSNLLEKLLASRLQQECKSKLFSAYAEKYMTKKIALQIYTLHMPVTKGVFAAAWNCVDEGEQEQLLLENCTVLDAVELAHKFKEMGGNYTALADRTRRHEVNLFATPQRIQLAKHLQTIGYITSWEEKEEKAFDSAVEKETSRKLLKLRIRQIKQPN